MEHLITVSSDRLRSLKVPKTYRDLFEQWSVDLDLIFETEFKGGEIRLKEDSIRLFYDEKDEFYEFSLPELTVTDFQYLVDRCNNFIDTNIGEINALSQWALANGGYDDRGEWE